MRFLSNVQGIPCQIQVNQFSAQNDAVFGHPDAATMLADDEFDYHVLDRRGRRAGWLERMVKPRDEARFMEEALRAN